MFNKTKPLIVIILLFFSISFVSANPYLLDNSFCDETGIEESNWNVSELIVGGVLSEDWSVLNNVNNWTTTSDLSGYWVGNDTFVFSGANISTSFSAAFVNRSQYNRSQSLVWTKVSNFSSNSDYVFSGVVYAYHNYTNFSMILFGDNEIFLFDYVDTGVQTYLRNTLDHSYGVHGGMVILYDDAVNYWTNDSVVLTGSYGAWIKTIYNTFCGSLKSKYWSGSPTLMNEPVDWNTEQLSVNMSTDDAVCMGVAFWNPVDHGCSNYSVYYDYVNNWCLNYTLNHSASITIDGVDHPRPHMDFNVIDMNNQGDDWWSLIMPSDFGGISANITNPSVSSSVRNITNNLSMVSRPFNTPVGRGTVTNDTIYYYTATLTNFTDWYIAYLAAHPDIWGMDPEYFSNNYLMVYVQNCEDLHAGSDDIVIGIDVDNNGQWDSNDRLILNSDNWLGWGGSSWTGNYLDGMYPFFGDVFPYCWTTEEDAPHNIHRYNNTVHYLTLIPLWSLVKNNGEYLNNSDVFGLHVSTLNTEHYGWGTCVWENWNETGCSTFFSEDGTESNELRYYNSSTIFTQACWVAIYDCWDDCDLHCAKHCADDFTTMIGGDDFAGGCWDDCMDDCYQDCLGCDECMIDIPDSNISLWGEGEIPGSPAVNSSSGHFDINLSVDSNVSYIPNEDMDDSIRINFSSDVENIGDETINDILINVSWKNCSCSYWVFSLVDTNINLSNISWYNSSCYMTFNITNLAPGEVYDFWIIIDILECSHYYGDLSLCVNASSDDGLGVDSVDCSRITWGTEPDSPSDDNGGTGGTGGSDVSVDVFDGTDHDPIPGAYVEVYDSDDRLVDTGYTDDDGRYDTSLEPGIYVVIVSIDGYETQTKILVVTSYGGVAFLMNTCMCPPIFHGPYINLNVFGWFVTLALVLVGFYVMYRLRSKKLDQDYLSLIVFPNLALIILGLFCQPILILIGIICLFLQYYYHEK